MPLSAPNQASLVSFDPTGTPLLSTSVEGAIDELSALVSALEGATPATGTTTILSTNTAVPADGTAGVPDPTQQSAGWYYKNTADLSEKINWYYLGGTAHGMTLASLEGQYALVDVRASGAPFFVVYTQPTGTGDATPWYKSRLVYTFPSLDLTAYIGQTVMLYWGDDPGTFVGTPRVECTLDAFTSQGPQGGAENIMFGAFATSTGYAAGSYEFVVPTLGYTYGGKTDQFQLSAPSGATGAPATPDDAYIELDGVNDYVSLSGTGSVLDYTATWTIGFEITTLPVTTTDNKFMTLVRSGNNAIALRRGGTNWGFYAGQNQYSVGQANTWVAPSAGSKVLISCDGVRLKYYLDGTLRANVAMNATYRDATDHVVNSLDFGRGGLPFGQGTFISYEGGCDNLLVTYNILSSAEIAEFFAADDVTNHSYYTAARDFVPFGEAGYPNVTGEKANVTGTLVNGTSDDFVERP